MLTMLDYKPDIIISSEFWLSDNLKFINLTGYCHYENHSRIDEVDEVML